MSNISYFSFGKSKDTVLYYSSQMCDLPFCYETVRSKKLSSFAPLVKNRPEHKNICLLLAEFSFVFA